MHVGELFPTLRSAVVPAVQNDLKARELTDLPRSEALHLIVSDLVAQSTSELGRMIPALEAGSSIPLEVLPLRVRTRNCLSQVSAVTLGDIARLTPEAILDLRNAGVGTLRDVVATCVQWTLLNRHAHGRAELEYPSNHVPEDDANEHEPPQPIPDAFVDVVRLLRRTAAWAVREGIEDAYSAVWEILSAKLPTDLREEWATLGESTLSTVADPYVVNASLDTQLEELLASLSPTAGLVLRKRLSGRKKRTLDEVGSQLGVTRERVRQIQVSAEARIEEMLESPVSRIWHWRAASLQKNLGTTAPPDHAATRAILDKVVGDFSSERRELALVILLRIAGPYREEDGWLMGPHAPARHEFEDLLDEDGLCGAADVSRWLSTRGVNNEFHEPWLTTVARARVVGDYVARWTGSIVDKCVALLAIAGEPIDAESLVNLVGENHSLRATRQRLIDDPRVARVGPSTFALDRWGLEEYSGIASEIASRIEQAGGRAAVNVLAADIANAFGVKEASVRLYAEAPMFVIEDGWVRLRSNSDVFHVSDDIRRCRGTYLLGRDRLSYALQVDREVARGSGRAIPRPVGARLTLEPGREVTFQNPAGAVRITWPLTGAFGPTLGSVRALINATGAEIGDVLRLEFDLGDSTVRVERIQPSDPVPDELGAAVRWLTGVDVGHDPLGDLGRAVGVSAKSVRDVLKQRGDARVADLLTAAAPETEVGGLEAALDDLGKALS